MSNNIFIYADPHFGHLGVCKFIRNDGITKLRPWDDVSEMDEELIKRYNNTVRPNDVCYFLGDVVMNRKALPTLSRLNGEKILVKGNHDVFRDDEYAIYFRELRAYTVLSGLILSHIPIHEMSLGRYGCNVHGHLHANRVMKAKHIQDKELVYSDEIDPRYWCASVEHTDFTPISLEDVKKKVIDQGGKLDSKNISST